MVITGASTGVGRAAALRFSGEGYSVCALARSADRLDELAMEAAEKIVPYPTDVSDSKQVERTVAKILEDHGEIDVLVNNAGVTSGGRPVDVATIDRIIDTNLKGALFKNVIFVPVVEQW
ncbi:MAG: SDR family oxidoreductase [Anaerolineae bacterium]|nr:SDR family oxidoreductase [Anaerolineae bacterium]